MNDPMARAASEVVRRADAPLADPERAQSAANLLALAAREIEAVLESVDSRGRITSANQALLMSARNAVDTVREHLPREEE